MYCIVSIQAILSLIAKGYKGNTPVDALLFLREFKNKF